MLKIMLCGASDTKAILEDFLEVAEDLQMVAFNYLTGKLRSYNGSNSSWEDNSRLTVKNMDMCVFVLLEKVGHITWDYELD
ncbi:MAG: hypothetical protein LBL15_02690, partial [Oscillospiraceae bacterium]|nr:hypothetical protein [Oscillospiraceae bacterium]